MAKPEEVAPTDVTVEPDAKPVMERKVPKVVKPVAETFVTVSTEAQDEKALALTSVPIDANPDAARFESTTVTAAPLNTEAETSPPSV